LPLSGFQRELGRLLAKNRSEDSYLAGDAAILAQPRSTRFSQDIAYFHDSAARVAKAFKDDQDTLTRAGIAVETDISQPGYIRAVVRRADQATKIEWAHDSAWRFMPVQRSAEFGYALHPVDLATNKVLALAGRDEARDLVDALYLHKEMLPLGALVWAAAGKDPGYSPLSLLEALRRHGKVRPEELARLQLSAPMDPKRVKAEWLGALDSADAFIRGRPAHEAGCLYYSSRTRTFVVPEAGDTGTVLPHFGGPGGVIPAIGGV
jgi:hypothetical protein